MNQDIRNSSEFDLDAVIDRFEASWKNNADTNLESFLPIQEDPNYRRVLCELIRVDLELRWNRGEQPIVEEYLRTYATDVLEPQDVEELAFEEYRMRFQQGQTNSPAEFAERLAIDTTGWPVWSHSQNSVERDSVGRSENRESVELKFPEIGSQFQGFEIVGLLGTGAFGRVYLARQENLAGRFVALKVTEVSNTEPQSLARLQHTNIIPIYSLKKDARLQSICMPFLGVATMRDLFSQSNSDLGDLKSGKELISTVAGKRTSTIVASAAPDSTPELTDVINRGHVHGASMPAITGFDYQQTALWMVGKVADGLAYAHSKGIVHGDLKPANILISDDGEPLLLDFHLARATTPTMEETLVGGTLPYMSARHLRSLQGGGDVDVSCDIFSLGVVLYESLTGNLPYESHGNDEIAIERMIQERSEPPLGVRQHKPEISVDVESIVARCLSSNPTSQYTSAREIQQDIENHLSNRPLVFAPNRSITERLKKWMVRHPKLTSGTTIAVLSLLLIGMIAGLVGNRLSIAAKIQRKSQSTEFVQTIQSARQPLAMQHGQMGVLSNAIEDALELVRKRTLGNSAQYIATLGELPDDIRQRELTELSSINYWIAYRLLDRANASTDDAIAKENLELANEQLNFVADVGKDLTPAAVVQLNANILERLGNAQAAQQLLNSIPDDQFVDTIPERLMVAAELLRQEDRQTALKQLEQLVSEKLVVGQSDIPQAWLMMGKIHFQMGNLEKADLCFATCIRLAPDAPWGYIHRGINFLQQRKFPDAKAEFDHAIAIDDQNSTTYLNRALAFKGMNQPQHAIENLSKAISLGAPETRAYYIRYQLLARLNKPDEAKRDLETFLDLEPNDEISWLSRGMANIRINKPERALADFESALRFSPTSTNALQNIATVESEYLNRTENAIAALTRIIELEPSNLVAIVTRGVLHARLLHRDSALADASLALKKSSQADIMFRAAGVFALTSKENQGDSRIAVDLLNKAAFKDPKLVLSRISTDSDLDSIRDMKEFKSLVEKLNSFAPPRKK